MKINENNKIKIYKKLNISKTSYNIKINGKLNIGNNNSLQNANSHLLKNYSANKNNISQNNNIYSKKTNNNQINLDNQNNRIIIKKILNMNKKLKKINNVNKKEPSILYQKKIKLFTKKPNLHELTECNTTNLFNNNSYYSNNQYLKYQKNIAMASLKRNNTNSNHCKVIRYKLEKNINSIPKLKNYPLNEENKLKTYLDYSNISNDSDRKAFTSRNYKYDNSIDFLNRTKKILNLSCNDNITNLPSINIVKKKSINNRITLDKFLGNKHTLLKENNSSLLKLGNTENSNFKNIWAIKNKKEKYVLKNFGLNNKSLLKFDFKRSRNYEKAMIYLNTLSSIRSRINKYKEIIKSKEKKIPDFDDGIFEYERITNNF